MGRLLVAAAARSPHPNACSGVMLAMRTSGGAEASARSLPCARTLAARGFNCMGRMPQRIVSHAAMRRPPAGQQPQVLAGLHQHDQQQPEQQQQQPEQQPKQPQPRVDAAKLTSFIKARTDWLQLQTLHQRYSDQLDFIHLAAIITHAAKLHTALQPAFASCPEVASLPSRQRSNARPPTCLPLIRTVVPLLLQQKHKLRARELCNVLWALSKLGLNPTHYPPLSELLLLLPHLAPQSNGQELSNTMYALAMMDRPLSGQRQAAPPLSSSSPPGAGPVAAAVTAGSAPALEGPAGVPGNRAPETLDLRPVMYRSLQSALDAGDLGPQGLANTTWALGRLSQLGDPPPPAPLLRTLMAALEWSLGRQASMGLSNLAVGLALLGQRPNNKWCKRFHESWTRSIGEASGQALANTLWALIDMGRPPPAPSLALLLGEVRLRLLRGGEPGVGRLSAFDVAGLLLYFTKMGLKPDLELIGESSKERKWVLHDCAKRNTKVVAQGRQLARPLLPNSPPVALDGCRQGHGGAVRRAAVITGHGQRCGGPARARRGPQQGLGREAAERCVRRRAGLHSPGGRHAAFGVGRHGVQSQQAVCGASGGSFGAWVAGARPAGAAGAHRGAG
jgi:hypothetical protein